MRKALGSPVDSLIEDLASGSGDQQTGYESYAAGLCVLVEIIADHVSGCLDAQRIDDDGLQKVIT